MVITSGRTEITKQFTTENEKTQQRTLNYSLLRFHLCPSLCFFVAITFKIFVDEIIDLELRLPVELAECITSILNVNADVMPLPHLELESQVLLQFFIVVALRTFDVTALRNGSELAQTHTQLAFVRIFVIVPTVFLEDNRNEHQRISGA